MRIAFRLALRLTFFAPLFALWFSAPVLAQTVQASDPAGLVSALQDMGYRAILTTDSVKDPKIESTVEGIDYSIFFYGCQDHRNCRTLQFSAGFDLTNGSSMQTINEWNSTHIAGKGLLDDENDPFVRYFVTTVGGLSVENFEHVITTWEVVVSQFTEFVGY